MRTTDQPEVQERATWSRPELRVLDVGGSESGDPSPTEGYRGFLGGPYFPVGPS